MQALAEQARGTRFPTRSRTSIPRAAHIPSLERPDEFDRLVLEFLSMTALEPVELVDRIWARDPTIWTGTDEAHWLGWLDEPGGCSSGSRSWRRCRATSTTSCCSGWAGRASRRR